MVGKVVANPASLSKQDIDYCLVALALYSTSIQRRINAEHNSEIKRLLEKQMDELEITRSNLRRDF